jgi:hypothetical protein
MPRHNRNARTPGRRRIDGPLKGRSHSRKFLKRRRNRKVAEEAALRPSERGRS